MFIQDNPSGVLNRTEPELSARGSTTIISAPLHTVLLHAWSAPLHTVLLHAWSAPLYTVLHGVHHCILYSTECTTAYCTPRSAPLYTVLHGVHHCILYSTECTTVYCTPRSAPLYTVPDGVQVQGALHRVQYAVMHSIASLWHQKAASGFVSLGFLAV